MSWTPKYSGETNWYVTADLPLRAFAQTRGARPATLGHEAATEATNGSVLITSRMAAALLLVQDPDFEDTRHADTEIDCRCRPRAAQEDGSADEEQDGSRHLQRDERIPGAAGRAITHHLATNRPHQLHARGLKRRCEREEQGRDDRAGHQEQRDAPVRWRDDETKVADIRRERARHCVDDACEHEP